MSVRYLTVDCVLKSTDDLSAIQEQLQDEIFLLWNKTTETYGYLGFETKLCSTDNPEQDITEFIRMFKTLPENMRKLLDDCHTKIFDIGFEVEEEWTGPPVDFELDSSLIKNIFSLDFKVNIRIYPLAESI